MNTTILIVEDDPDLSEAVSDTLEMNGYDTISAVNGIEALEILGKNSIQMVISDVRMDGMDGHTLLKKIKSTTPTIPVLMMTAYGTVEKAVKAIQHGAIDYLLKPFEPEVLVSMVSRFALPVDSGINDFIANDKAMKSLVQLASKVAASDASVMITGESGTGKEVMAKFMHNNSHRAHQPFIAINCAAIPDTMLESLLFGHEKGAYTGAHKSSPGKFEQANGGTLLLDEISEMDIGLQAKILRVIQEQEVERLGGNKIIKLDVRILSTSNRDMLKEIKENRFREDLYFRLNVFPIHIPPLRERRDDIVPLAEFLINRIVEKSGGIIPKLDDGAKKELSTLSLYGNVRELDNILQRVIILCSENVITANDVALQNQIVSAPHQYSEKIKQESKHKDIKTDLKSQEQNLILETLRKNRGNRTKTAKELKISDRTLRYKIAKMRDSGVEIPGKN